MRKDAWGKKMDDRLAEMWNTDMLVIDIAAELGRTKNACIWRVYYLRLSGVPLRDRTNKVRGERAMPPAPEFVMPAGMRYEDDPRAGADRGSAFMPKKPDYQSGGSSLWGGQLRSGSGKHGAVA